LLFILTNLSIVINKYIGNVVYKILCHLFWESTNS